MTRQALCVSTEICARTSGAEWFANQLETHGCQQITVGMLGKQTPRQPWVDDLIAEVFRGPEPLADLFENKC